MVNVIVDYKLQNGGSLVKPVHTRRCSVESRWPPFVRYVVVAMSTPVHVKLILCKGRACRLGRETLRGTAAAVQRTRIVTGSKVLSYKVFV